MSTITIPESELPHIEWIANLPDSDFDKLFQAIKGASASLTVREFSQAISKEADFISEDELQGILKTLFAMHWLKERSGTPTEEFAADLTTAMLRQCKNQGEISVERKAERFAKLMRLPSLGVTAKALDVMTEHERVFCGARILTDMRPVFLEDGEKAAAVMIVHQLKLSFHQNGTHKELYFALDDADIEELLLTVEKARKKSKTLEKIIFDAKLSNLKV